MTAYAEALYALQQLTSAVFDGPGHNFSNTFVDFRKSIERTRFFRIT
jgi:hypothetical protein